MVGTLSLLCRRHRGGERLGGIRGGVCRVLSESDMNKHKKGARLPKV